MKDFLAQLRKNNIHLSLQNGDISVKYLSDEIDTVLLQEIRAKKEDLVDYLSALNRDGFAGIQPAPAQADYPLSAAQRRLWLLSQLDEANIAYNVPLICTFEGELNITALDTAFNLLVARHEILRTAFRENEEGVVRQYIQEAGCISFNIVQQDLRAALVEDSIHLQVQDIISRPFKLVEGSLLSAHLLQVAQERYVFVCVMHHIISDGWSTGVMMQELLTVYNHISQTGKRYVLPSLRIQYKDYAVWQHAQLSGEKLQAHQQYWLQQLGGNLPVLDFAADHPRPAIKTYNGAVVDKKIAPHLLDAFKAHLQPSGATLFMGLLALVNALLYRYTGQQDIVIGSPIAGRDHIDLEDQIGFYVNMLALRTRWAATDSYLDLLKEVKQVTLGAYEHQVYPFDTLVEDVYKDVDASRHPLFDVVLVLQNMSHGGQEEQDASLEKVKVNTYNGADRVVSLFDMRLDFREADGALFFMVEYNSDIYDRARMDRFGDNLIALLESIVKEPGLPLIRHTYISEAEQKSLTANVNEAIYPVAETIVSLFETQADRTPDHVAVVLDDQLVTYRQLEERANRIAHFLINETGLQREQGVAIILNRVPDCIAAMLGILKAGGMYIPLDPDQPEERLKFMIRDAGASVLITGKMFLETANRLQWACNDLKTYLCVDSDDVLHEKELTENIMMSQELWDHVGEKAVDQITGGGWGNSFTGKPISDKEMEEYAMNAYRKLAPLLHKEMRVLEIGCSSGLTLNKVAPEVGFYYGTDLSPVIISNTRNLIAQKGMTHVQLQELVAHEIGTITERDFDLVIINSVIQHFHGHNYLRDVINQATSLMKDTGYIFIGDIMDADRKEALIGDLTRFKIAHKGKGYQTKTDFSADLFVAKGFFEDLVLEDNPLVAVEAGEKICTIENELTKYRYDAILQIDKKQAFCKNGKRNKQQFSNTALLAQPATRPSLQLAPDNLAYLIYTSGTTGQPKGVQVQHYNVVRLFMTDRPLFHFDETDVWTMFHSCSFDFSVWEIYGALFYGGRLVLVPKETAQDAAAYLQLLSREKVTVLNQTPSAFYNLSEEAVAAKPSLYLRYAIFGGEALSPGKLKAWNINYPDVKLINMYGITETTVHVTYKEITTIEITQNISNIGKPIPTLSGYVLDAHGNLLPIGVPGELYIGGAGVARGYLNRDTLTATRFLPDTFTGTGRLYRSGDKVKMLENGEMEYLGRMDHQVKIRGYRIETGEIEARLLEHEQVDKAKVIAREDKTGGKYLAAYLVGDTDINIKELRELLARQLPEYMVPSFFIPVQEFPLTRNGKINTSQLPDPLRTSAEMEDGYAAPRDVMEQVLVTIWEDILGRERIGIDDNFFELGGHSLKAMQLKSRIQKAFEKQIELRDIFSHITIRDQARLLQQNAADAYTGIPKVEIQESYPVSHSQRRFWALSQLDESALAYNMPGVLFLDGDLDLQVLEDAVNYIIQRHESLRTVFRESNTGEIRQHILTGPPTHLTIQYLDISGAADPDEQLAALYTEDQLTLFDLAQELLLKIKLAKVKEGRHAFFYLMHHIICDGWSMEILAGELAAAYNSFRMGETPGLPPLQVQYKDYAAWKYQQLQGTAFLQDETYWLKQLSGALPVLDLPTDFVRPPMKTYQGGCLEMILPDELVQALRACCNQHAATLFMGLLAGLNGLLYRYTGQTDIIVGTPIAGREHQDLENQIGLYLNTLALRTQFAREDHFAGLLANVKDVLLGGYSHGAYPFDLLVEKLRIRKDMSRLPLFDVCMVLQNQRSTNVNTRYKGMEDIHMVELENRKNETSQFDLLFNFNEKDEEIRLMLSYSTDLFTAAAIDRLYDHYIQFLRAVIAAPQTPLCKINYLTPTEETLVCKTFNTTAHSFPEKNVVQLFEEQVSAHPENPAVIFEGETLTYKELNERAAALAAHLQTQYQLEPGKVAAVMMDRSAYAVVALLAVLKTGAAYVPVDPAYPDERCRYMLSHSKASLLLTDIGSRAGDLFNGSIVIPTQFAQEAPATVFTADVIHPADLAYIIYTSGSTGTPKGCMISHNNLSNYIQWANGYYFPENAGGTWGLITSLSFDLTVTAIYTSLTRGKPLYIGSAEKDMMQLLEACFLHPAIDTLKLTPSHLSLLQGLQIPHTAIRTVICGGEQLTAAQVAILKGIDERINIYNEYGPTETTVGCVAGKVTDATQRISIGQPAANMEIYILDEQGLLCPPGVYGEMYIGGAGVGAGYLYAPEQTAARFISHPFSPGKKVYRSGDIGKWLPDGNILFAGRKDGQVKINGHRIETEEIVQTLLQQEGVQDAVITMHAEGNHLTAYFVADSSIATPTLRAGLQQRLPGYMIPRYFVQLDAIPVTPHGKVDGSRLPDPQENGNAINQDYVAPADEQETILAGIWKTILEIDRIGTNDNFFELGGNSLNVLRLNAAIKKETGVELSMRDILAYPTIGQLRKARFGEHAGAQLLPSSIQVYDGNIQPHRRNIFFIPPSSGISYWYMELLKELQQDANSFILNYRGIFDDEPPYKDINELTQEFLQHILIHATPEEPVFMLGYSSGGPLIVMLAGLLEAQGYKPVLFILDAVPKAPYEEPIRDKETFVSTIFPDIERFRTLAAGIGADETALEKFLEMAFNFHCLWPDFSQPEEHVNAPAYIFVNNRHKNDMTPYHKWKNYLKGDLYYQVLETGEHMQLLQYRENIALICMRIRAALKIFR